MVENNWYTDRIGKREITYGPKMISENERMTVTVCFDDRCKNGHNTFSITANIDEKRGHRWREDAIGCLHDMIAMHFPELAHLIKWHLCGTNGPMHYLANTLYHASAGNIEYARSTAIAPNANLDQLSDGAWLAWRLPGLMDDFRSAMSQIFAPVNHDNTAARPQPGE